MPRIRYRDNQIVTQTGEKFIKENLTLDPGPGCHIGGILGARKAGRQGLGLRKRPKEETERIRISNKQRAHVKVDSNIKAALRFETKSGHGLLVPGGQGSGGLMTKKGG
mmetsp:Transcript_128274/g.221404  ORF Transcript_128274/g.221404 Transcript_128274/m.221404 type:complete len:109 (+) Transcript_128274:213-539(+)